MTIYTYNQLKRAIVEMFTLQGASLIIVRLKQHYRDNNSMRKRGDDFLTMENK